MAIVKAVSSRASIVNAINYITKKEKTEEKLISGIDCDPNHALDQMKITKKIWHKTEGRQYMHFVQSFAQGENLTPQQAHKIAMDLFKDRFKGYEILIATHKDKGHIHSHIIVNSVSYEDGYKLQHSKEDYKKIKLDSDELCQKHGLSITEKGKTFEGKDRKDMTSFKKDKYQVLLKAENGEVKSYVYDTAVDSLMSKTVAKSKEEFIAKMAEKGYKTDWQDNHKYITFTDKDGNKVRNSNIEKTYTIEMSKEALEKEFAENQELGNKKKQKEESINVKVETCELKPEIEAPHEEPTQEKDEEIEPEGKEKMTTPHPQNGSITTEEKLKKLYKLKASYISLENQIENIIELKSNITAERNRLESSAREVAQLANNITQTNVKISELDIQKQSLSIFKGKEKKQLDEQIKSLEMRKQQTEKELYLKFNISQNQASEKVNELLNKHKKLGSKVPPSDKVDHLRTNQEIIEIEFKTEKLLLENDPNKIHIEEELKKINKPYDGGRQNLMSAAKVESKLRKITPDDFKNILRHNPNNEQIVQIVQAMQQQNSLPKGLNKGPTLRR